MPASLLSNVGLRPVTEVKIRVGIMRREWKYAIDIQKSGSVLVRKTAWCMF